MNVQTTETPHAEAAPPGPPTAEADDAKAPAASAPTFDVKAVAREEYNRSLYSLFVSKESFEAFWDGVALGPDTENHFTVLALLEAEYRLAIKGMVRSYNGFLLERLAASEARTGKTLRDAFFLQSMERLGIAQEKGANFDSQTGTLRTCDCKKERSAESPQANAHEIVISLSKAGISVD